MDVIGNNIANINTIGFKAGRATFSELYAQTLQGGTQSVGSNGGINPIQVGLGMKTSSIDNLFTQGNIETTGQNTDLAIQGQAFFIVKKDGKDVYTRAGGFSLDGSGRLVNPGDGSIVQGKLADNLGNIPSGTQLSDLTIPLDQKSPAHATTTVKFAGNLDSSAAVGTVVNSSVSVFDAMGNQHTVTLTFTNTGTNAWSWSAAVPLPATTASAGTVTFDGTGALNTLTGSPLTVTTNNGSPNLSVVLDMGTPGVFSGLTQSKGDSTVTPREQDGYGSGTLNGISIDAGGRINGTFSNGTVMTLGQIMLAEFNNPSGLLKSGDNSWDVSGNSGTPAIVSPGNESKIVSGALEQSNVDLSNEFTQMITAQRGFQANARVITTSDEFLQEIVNLKR